MLIATVVGNRPQFVKAAAVSRKLRETHEELLIANGRYKQLYDKQYNFERDRFINPGEDFTPEPEQVAVPPVAPPGRL